MTVQLPRRPPPPLILRPAGQLLTIAGNIPIYYSIEKRRAGNRPRLMGRIITDAKEMS